ncbi:MAG: hypothetical protein ABJL99_03235 [Aliishimia sp.]
MSDTRRQSPSRPVRIDGRIEPGTFLEKRSYRRRRLTDGLRLLPVLGLWVFMVPVFWPEGSDGDGAGAVSMSGALVYIFAAWCGLIAVCGLLVRAQKRGEDKALSVEPTDIGAQ